MRHRVRPDACTGTRADTVGPHDEYAPVLKSAAKSRASSLPSLEQPPRSRMRAGCLFVVDTMDSFRESRLGLDVGVLNKSGFVLGFHHRVGCVQCFIDVAPHHSSPHQNISGAVLMDQPCPRRQRSVNISERRQFFPTHRKVRSLQRLYRCRFTNHRRYRLSAMPSFTLSKHRLIRELADDSVAILSGHIFRSKDGVNPRMISNKRRQIAEVKSRAMIRAANRTYRQCASRSFIRAKNLAAVDL